MHFSANRIFTRQVKFILLIACLFIGFLWFIRWSNPEKRVPATLNNTLTNIENGRWAAAERRLHENYRDPWSQNRGNAVMALRGIARQFEKLNIKSTISSIRIEDDFALIQCTLHVEGSGSIRAINALREWNAHGGELTIRMQKTGTWPGSWKILRVEMDDPPRL